MDRTSHLVLTVLLAVFLIAFGTAGYMLIEGWTLMDALYMTGITLTTVGYGEVHQISQSDFTSCRQDLARIRNTRKT